MRRVVDLEPDYFLTLCTANRTRVLAEQSVDRRVREFAQGSMARYGIWVDCYMIMPDHVHLIARSSRNAKVAIGEWVKGFKAYVAEKRFKWQAGFFDHVLRSDESRSEKWDYIRENPVREGLVSTADEWPYACAFDRRTGDQV